MCIDEFEVFFHQDFFVLLGMLADFKTRISIVY